MDFFNRTPTIPEDTVQYTIHLSSGFSDKTSVTTLAACIHAHVNALLQGFIWHRDAFELKVVQNLDNGQQMLEGRMRVGDCVDDEWCTVWLLKEISSKWDVAISVFDSDGEFLLIEAADDLPAWVKPTNSENRVWIYSSRLHLVPISHISPPAKNRRRRKLPGLKDNAEDEENLGGNEDDNDFIAADDALLLVRDPSINTLAPPLVENIVWARIAGYPDSARNHIHVTRACLPIDVAKALSIRPSLAQKAVETFYTRDAIQLRAAHRMSRFPPELSVLSSVKLTRTAYAQLVGQKFFPPKVFGRWQEREGTDEWRWRDIGMKIAVGFEMLYQESKGRTDKSSSTASAVKSSDDARKDILRRNPEYIKYIQGLVPAGYFQGEVEGSELWNTLESKAATLFVEVRREDDASRPSFAAQVTSALSQASGLPFSPILQEEDNDDWLNIEAQEFEDMLEKTMGASKFRTPKDPNAMDVDKADGQEETSEDHVASTQASRLQALAAKVENFVEGEGDLEGARFEDEDFSDEPFSDEEDMSSDSGDENLPEESAVRQAAMDKLVPGLEPSDYGKMPASFHSNSQRVAPGAMEEPDPEDLTGPSPIPKQARPSRQPILPRDRYDGVDSDDETDEEDQEEDEDEEEDKPQVVGDIEIDMGEEEEEFLEFSRQALGITDAQWNDIVQDRKGRGAFVPASAASQKPAPKPPASDHTSSTENKTQGQQPAPGPRPNVNPNLDSFESVMKAMDEELVRSRTGKKHKTTPTPQQPSERGKGKAKATAIDEGEDIEAAMDAELRATLENADEDGDGEDPMDYGLIKNFLESFKSQAGLSGPVSNLAGRLQPGWKLPRDES